MANIARQEMGLDAAQAAGGWKTREVVEKTYTDAPNKLNKEVVDYVERMVVGSKYHVDTNKSEICTSSRGLKLVQSDDDL